MKIKIKNSFFLLCYFFVSVCAHSQQTFVNREWSETSPEVGNNIIHTSTIVTSGKLTVTGNILNGSGNTDIYTYRLDTNGDTLWTATYAGSAGGDDYGVELREVSGNIYVIAAAKNSVTGYDYCVLRYNATNGNQIWVYNWNGVGNGDDIPTSLVVENTGSAIYVCGGTEASNGLSDFGVIKLSSSSSLNWAKYYDYNNLHDGATSISFSGLSHVIVTGGSAAGIGDWDLASVRISKTTGSMSSSRTNITGATMVEAKAMTTDSLNNLYITGYAEIGGDKNMQTIKLDSTLSLVWIRNYDGGHDDIGNDIGLDSAGNVYVTGYSGLANYKNKGVLIKYSETGDTLFTKLYGNTRTDEGAQFRKIAVQQNGDSYITGTEGHNGLNSFSFVKFNGEGDLLLSKSYQADTLDDEGFSIVVDNNDVYITGFTETIGGRTMTSIKYSLHYKDSALYYDSGVGLYKNRDLIMRIDTSHIILEEINKLEIEYWDLNQIFESSFVTTLHRALEVPCADETCDVKVYRIFKSQQINDTITTTRLGERIKIPAFWSTFVFEFPDGVDILEVEDSLRSLFPDIKFIDYNYVVVPCSSPNDPQYYLQKSLHPTGDPDCDSAHVNVEPAWEHTVGESFIRVGVFDDGIHKLHPDFSDTSGSTYKMIDGWDYIQGVDLHSSTFNGGFHASATGGVIGANRNDDFGVAGIAGGDDSLSNPGVSLYDLRILIANEHFSSDMSMVANAIYESSIEDTTLLRGYGLNVTNNSWILQTGAGALPSPYNLNLLREQIHFANRAQVTFVAARGNAHGSQIKYPACFDDKWVLCVGGTGGDGQYYDGNSPCDGTAELSNYGNGVDVAAPAGGLLIWVPDMDGSTWSYFGGTSGASPHVAGAVGLLMSYHNDTFPSPNNLAPEDSENLIQLSADDTDYPGYDDYTGYGRLNVGRAVNMLAEDHCYITHYGITDSTSFTVSFQQIMTAQPLKFEYYYVNQSDDYFQPFNPGGITYNADVIKATFTFTFPATISSDTLRAAWVRHSSSSFFGLKDSNDFLYPYEEMELTDVTETSATLVGYAYKVYQGSSLIGWVPHSPYLPVNQKVAFTVFRCDTNLVTADMPEEFIPSSINVYPNPGTDMQTIEINASTGQDLNIVLYDASGRLVKDVYTGKTTADKTLITVSLANLPKGLYFYEIMIGNELRQSKIIIQ